MGCLVTQKPSIVLIKGGEILDALGTRRSDVAIEDGYIVAVGENLSGLARSVILDASGCVVCPGLVDLHSHLREPGGEEAETLESGARAAALGGYTAVVAMPNTSPAIDSSSMVRDVLAAGAKACVQVAVAGTITLGRRGEQLAPFAELARAGVKICTDDGSGVQDPALMRRALEYARPFGITLAQHCEVAELAGGGVMHEGVWSSKLGLPGIPSEAEDMMVERDISLVRRTGGPLHFMHLSSAASVRAVAGAKAEGLPITAEVTPHHLALTDACLSDYDPLFKVNPPLRSQSDREALCQAVTDGIIDAIATDHAPHPLHAKQAPLDEAAPGMVGLETSFAVANSELSHLPLAQIIAAMSSKPALIAGLDGQGGPIVVGRPANLTVLDPNATWTVDPERMATKSTNTPFGGRILKGKVRHTVTNGEVVVMDGQPQR